MAWLPSFPYANDSVGVVQGFTSVGAVTAGNAIAAIAAATRPGMSSGVKRIAGISKVRKDDSIIAIVSSVTGNGDVSEKKA